MKELIKKVLMCLFPSYRRRVPEKQRVARARRARELGATHLIMEYNTFVGGWLLSSPVPLYYPYILIVYFPYCYFSSVACDKRQATNWRIYLDATRGVPHDNLLIYFLLKNK